jgi:DinB superfamily
MRSGPEIADDLRSAVNEGVALFADTTEAQTAFRSAPGRWSARQILGHLIDSANNNHRRFVLNQGEAPLVFQSYDQERWVDRGRYQDSTAFELVELWTAYNRQLARLIAAITPDDLTRSRGPMGDHRFPYTSLPPSDDVTLGHFVEDYVGHIRHHLKQIRGLLNRRPDNPR